MNSVRGMVELVNNAGDIHVDFADVRAVMNNGGIAMMGIGESRITSYNVCYTKLLRGFC